MQVPSAQFKLLCGRVLKCCEDRKLLLILDDVWEEDFSCFRTGRLDLLGMRNGSRCVLTSRHRGLTGGCLHGVPLSRSSIDGTRAFRILTEYAALTPGAMQESSALRVRTDRMDRLAIDRYNALHHC